MHYLFVTWSGGGNVDPALLLAQELVRRGHMVSVLGHRSMEAEVLGLGFTFRSFRSAPDFVDAREVGNDTREPRTPIGAFVQLRDRLLLGPADRFCADTLSVLEELRPDVLIVDFMLPGALIAGEKAGTPTAAFVHTVYPYPAADLPPLGLGWQPARNRLERLRDRVGRAGFRWLWLRGLDDFNRARTDHGLEPVSDIFEWLVTMTRVIVATSPAFDYPSAYRPPNTVYVGAPRRSAGVRQWHHPRHDLSERPLVVVSYSTTNQDQSSMLQRAADALGRLDVRGLITTGRAIDPRSIRALPNTVIERYVQHEDVLPQTAVLVSHGGHGSVMAALTEGVPVLCVPQGRDQFDVAARVKRLGAGTDVSHHVSGRRLARRISAMLGEPSYRLAAEHARSSFERDATAGQAMRVIEDLTAAGRSF